MYRGVSTYGTSGGLNLTEVLARRNIINSPVLVNSREGFTQFFSERTSSGTFPESDLDEVPKLESTSRHRTRFVLLRVEVSLQV